MTDINQAVWPGWETVRVIGSGSYGSVYEIRREMFGNEERAALKVMSIPQTSSEVEELINEGYDQASISGWYKEQLENIYREYSLMNELKGQANVVQCDDFRHEPHADGIGWNIYIKMELLTPLTKSIDQRDPQAQAVRVGEDICQALVACKRRGIVHRDIKPQNIMVSRDGVYKLGDFGIAKNADKTVSGTKIGTFKYMAPEVYNNQPYGSRADVYSLGMVLYWLLNERRAPFIQLPPHIPGHGELMESDRRRFSGETLPAPAHGSGALKAAVLKACAFDPRERFGSPEEMLAALKAAQGNAAECSEEAAPAQEQKTVEKPVIRAEETMDDVSGNVYTERASVKPVAETVTVMEPTQPEEVLPQSATIKVVVEKPVKKRPLPRKSARKNAAGGKKAERRNIPLVLFGLATLAWAVFLIGLIVMDYGTAGMELPRILIWTAEGCVVPFLCRFTFRKDTALLRRTTLIADVFLAVQVVVSLVIAWRYIDPYNELLYNVESVGFFIPAGYIWIHWLDLFTYGFGWVTFGCVVAFSLQLSHNIAAVILMNQELKSRHRKEER